MIRRHINPIRHVHESLERRPELNYGEIRLTAEAVLAQRRGEIVPHFVQERADRSLLTMAGLD